VNNAPSRTIACTHVIGAPQALAGAQAITIAGDAFASIEPASAPSKDQLLAMPALVNARGHGRAIQTVRSAPMPNRLNHGCIISRYFHRWTPISPRP
jgi:hypothetical protein